MAHSPNPETYRPWLGTEYNILLIALTEEANAESLDSNLHPQDIIRRWILRAWRERHPNEAVPNLYQKPYHKDIDFVQSA